MKPEPPRTITTLSRGMAFVRTFLALRAALRSFTLATFTSAAIISRVAGSASAFRLFPTNQHVPIYSQRSRGCHCRHTQAYSFISEDETIPRFTTW